jgi:hypothetical protein
MKHIQEHRVIGAAESTGGDFVDILMMAEEKYKET